MAPLAYLAHLMFGHRRARRIRSACTWCCDLAVCACSHHVQVPVLAFHWCHRIGRHGRHRKRQNNNCQFSDHRNPPTLKRAKPQLIKHFSHTGSLRTRGAWRLRGEPRAYAIKPFGLVTVPVAARKLAAPLAEAGNSGRAAV
jgi:hypothetical protein